jgi:hypothetical protein
MRSWRRKLAKRFGPQLLAISWSQTVNGRPSNGFLHAPRQHIEDSS